jgi:hypothetical protein
MTLRLRNAEGSAAATTSIIARRHFTRDECALFTKDERGATTHRLQVLADGLAETTRAHGLAVNFQTHPFSVRLSERRPMNSTMKGFSQSCSGIRRKRAKAASNVS